MREELLLSNYNLNMFSCVTTRTSRSSVPSMAASDEAKQLRMAMRVRMVAPFATLPSVSTSSRLLQIMNPGGGL